MLALLPLLAYMGTVLVLANLQTDLGWRRSALRGVILWGCYLTAVTELLSLAHAVHALWLAVAWGGACVLLGVVVVRCVRRRGHLRLPVVRLPVAWGERALLGAIAVVVILTAVVAWVAPPQTWDSLNYHLSRVAHWAQDRSVAPFATGIETQNSRTPWAEFSILNLYVLAGGDRLANGVQWSAMLLSLVGISLVAGELGASAVGQWLAAAFAASLPMGIVQASSSITDYVVALWVVCAVCEWVALAKRHTGKDSLVYASLAAGLGALTKPTAYAFLLPIAILMAITTLLRWGWGSTLRWCVAAVATVLLLNAGHLIRTYRVYGSLIEGEQFDVHANQAIDLQGLVSNALRNVTMELGTPSPYANKAIYQAVLAVHRWIGLDLNDPRTTSAGRFAVRPPQTSEDLATNPLQTTTLLFLVPWVLLRRRTYAGEAIASALALLAAFLLFCLVFKWQIFGVRYHLPLFALGAPLVGVTAGQVSWKPAPAVFGCVLIVASWPWLLQIDTRPLVPGPQSTVGSILTTERRELYFANAPYLEDPENALTNMIRSSGCSRVGLNLSGNSAEYLWWVGLGAPSPRLRIEWIVAGTASARLSDPSFQPCAVVCENCASGWQGPGGMPVVATRGGYTLFMGK